MSSGMNGVNDLIGIPGLVRIAKRLSKEFDNLLNLLKRSQNFVIS